MKTSLKIGAAYVSAVIGAGIASGQELLQYFTYYGWISFASIIIATIMFSWLGGVTAGFGSELQASSHKTAANIVGGKFFGLFLDITIIVASIVFYVAMIAGGGSLLNQMFDVPIFWGRALIAIIVAITVMFDIKRIVDIIAFITPFMVLMAAILAVNTYLTSNLSFSDVTNAANLELTNPPHLWFLSGPLYVSFNSIVIFAVMVVIGGTVKDRKVAVNGGIYGGIMLGAIVLMVNSGLIAKLNFVEGVDMPTLLFASHIAPWLAIVMGLVIFGMVYSSAVTGLTILMTRIAVSNKKYEITLVITISLISYLLSAVGFINLVYYIYPILSYLGIPLIIVVFIRWIIKINRESKVNAARISNDS